MHKKPIFDLLTKKLLLRKCLYPIDFQAIEEIATGYSTGKNTIQAVRKALLIEDIPCEDRLRDDHCLKRFLSL